MIIGGFAVLRNFRFGILVLQKTIILGMLLYKKKYIFKFQHFRKDWFLIVFYENISFELLFFINYCF